MEQNKQEPKQAVVPVEPTEEMIQAMAIAHEKSPAHDLIGPMEDAYRALIAAAPQQQGEPVYQYRYEIIMDGPTRWSDWRDITKEQWDQLEGDGMVERRILYTSSPSYDQGFAEAIETASTKLEKFIEESEEAIGVQFDAHRELLEDIRKLKPTTSIQDTSQAKPDDTITMSRDKLRALIEEIEAIMKGEHGSDWADHFATLFDRLYTVSRALEGK